MKFSNLSIKWKVLLITLLAPIILSFIFAFQRMKNIHEQEKQAIINRSKVIVLMAESARNEMADKLKNGIIKPLEQLSGDRLLESIPVITAMKLAMRHAKTMSYEFRVPKINPRNSKNEPDLIEKHVLEEMKAKDLIEKIVIENNQIRYFKPIRLTEECSFCHGFPQGEKDPTGGIKEGWNSGEIHGAFEIISSLDNANKAAAKARISILLWTSLVLIIIITAIWILIKNHVLTPLKQSEGFIKNISTGDLTVQMSPIHDDELGSIIVHLNKMSVSLKDMLTHISSGIETLSGSSEKMFGVSKTMVSSVDLTSSNAQTVSKAAGLLSNKMNDLSKTSSDLSSNVNMVAKATDEMKTNIHDISQRTTQTGTITNNAVVQAKKAQGRLENLDKSVVEIGKITETITDISEQTNLLALNATIEAARAGEAGKGFAVVANEIKELSKQTSHATEEIKKKIDGIQNETAKTVTEIIEILQVINQVNEMVSSIAESLKEQSKTTNDIAKNIVNTSTGIQNVTLNVSESSTMSNKIADDIAYVNQSSIDISKSSSQVKNFAQELAKLAEELRQLVDKFKINS